MSSVAAAPSVTCDELPAVDVPSSLNAGLSENLTSSLIGLLEKCSQHKDNFTIKSSKELNELWNLASVKNLNVCEYNI